ncbi:TetR family transcriptional regulator [Mycolicibacterium smegmatis]|uniref:TetR/AcrR family transcriptional regulator n=1 Tax=Mycolicibacterium smegmatis TaxID=1772 RepID=UPI001E315D3C|nr:TetR family transcriptional regulator C-terminal domain-containing protein [Mycolicibacterium smegmatis]UGU33112.1 TetR family transcriptional regulator [Mycolicibacterium smegmatis]ULN67992.1 TetR family transcriptional regulator [Mycolicibacterium smegmatis]
MHQNRGDPSHSCQYLSHRCQAGAPTKRQVKRRKFAKYRCAATVRRDLTRQSECDLVESVVRPAEEVVGVTTQINEDVRRTAILDAAAQLIAERGYHAVRIADIAALVGTSTGAVHYYFPGKQEVLTAALQHAVDRSFDRQSVELVKIDNAHQRLLKLFDMQLPRPGPVRDEWSIWMQFWAEATIRPELRPVHNTYYARWHETVSRIVKRGQRQGVFRSDIDPETVAKRLTALTDGVAIQVVTGAPDMTVSAMKEFLVQFVQDELLRRP